MDNSLNDTSAFTELSERSDDEDEKAFLNGDRTDVWDETLESYSDEEQADTEFDTDVDNIEQEDTDTKNAHAIQVQLPGELGDKSDSGEENLDGTLSETLISPSNVSVPPTSKQPLNQANCYTYPPYDMDHNEKNASDTEPNSWQDKSLNDLYPHLIEMPARRHNGLMV